MTCRLSAVLLLAAVAAASAEELAAPVLVREHAGVARVSAPVTGGVPVGLFRVKRAQDLAMFDASGRPLPCQIIPTVTAPDGTLTWVLVDFQTDLAANDVRTFSLRRAEGEAAPSKYSVRVDQTDDAVTVNTGVLKAVLSRKSFDLFDQVWIDRNGDGRFTDDEQMLRRKDQAPQATEGSLVLADAATGKTFTTRRGVVEKVSLEDSGPLRATVRVDGRHGDGAGGSYLKYTARLTFWAGSPSVKLLYSIRNANREANTAAKIRRAAVTLNTAVGGQGVTHYFAGAAGPRLSRLDVGEQANLPKSTQRHSAVTLEQRGPERAILSVTDRNTFHMGVEFDEIGFRVLMDQPSGRKRFADCGLSCQGWLDLADDRGGCVVWLRNFTENPLKRLRADGYGRMDLELIPEYDGAGQMFYAGGGYWITDSAYRTYEIGFHFHGKPFATEADWKAWMGDERTTYSVPTPQTAAACQAALAPLKDPLLAVSDPDWYSRTGALYGPVPSVEDEARVNKLWGRTKEGPVRANRQEELATEFLPRENYHWRSESDEPRDCLIQYVRTGRYDLLKRARSFANVARDMGVFRCDGKPLGKRPVVNLATTQRDRGLCETGWGSTKMCGCHNYGAGLVDMWLFTGDRSYLEAAIDNTENHVGMPLRGEDRGCSRIADGALRLFEVTHEPRYRDWLKDSAVFETPVAADARAGRYVGSWMHSIVIFARYHNLRLNGEAMDPRLREATRNNIIAWAREAAVAVDAPPAPAKSKSEYGLCAIYTIMAGYELTGDRKLLEAARRLWDKEHLLGPDVVDARMQDWGPSSGANFYWVSLLFDAYAHPRADSGP